MREELEKVLLEKYPKLLRGYFGGLSHGDGWFNIINVLCFSINEHIQCKRTQRARDLLFNRRLRRAIVANDFTLLLNPKLKNEKWHIGQCKHDFYAGAEKDVTPKVDRVVVRQVKEKFGTLRFYYDGGDETVSGMVRMAEQMSAVTCEVCGDIGKQHGGGWISTLCEDHAKKKKKN